MDILYIVWVITCFHASHTFAPGSGLNTLLSVHVSRRWRRNKKRERGIQKDWRNKWWGLFARLKITPGPSRDPASSTPSKHFSLFSSLSLFLSTTGLLERERGRGRKDWNAGHQCTAAPSLNCTAVHLCRIISIQASDRRHYNIHRLPDGLLEDEPPFGGKEDEGLSCHYRLVFFFSFLCCLSSAGTRSVFRHCIFQSTLFCSVSLATPPAHFNFLFFLSRLLFGVCPYISACVGNYDSDLISPACAPAAPLEESYRGGSRRRSREQSGARPLVHWRTYREADL